MPDDDNTDAKSWSRPEGIGYLLSGDLWTDNQLIKNNQKQIISLLTKGFFTLNNDDAALTAEVAALKQQETAEAADVIAGLASVVAAFQKPDTTVETATANLTAIGVAMAGSQSAFDSAVQAAGGTVSAPTIAPSSSDTLPAS
jgi:hypothetical protein